MKQVFLVQQTRLKVDWSYLKKQGLKIILISDAPTRAKLSDHSIEFIHKIHTVEEFDFEVLKGIIEKECAEEFSIITTDEFLVSVVACLNQHFGSPGIRPEQAIKYLNKAVMKESLRSSRIRLPRYVRFDFSRFLSLGANYLEEVIAHTGLPCFVKPLDQAGAKGTCFIDSREEFMAWAKSSECSIEYEVDEFIQGELYHVDSVVLNGNIQTVLAGKYFFPLAFFFDGKICGSTVLPSDSDHYSDLTALNEEVLMSLGMHTGVFHLEAFRSNTGEFVFLEVGARPAGALVPDLYDKAYGIKLHEEHILSQAIGKCTKQSEQMQGAFWMWIPQKEGILIKVYDIQIECFTTYEVRYSIGAHMKNPTEIIDRFSGLLSWSSDVSQMEKDIAKLLDSQFFEVEAKMGSD